MIVSVNIDKQQYELKVINPTDEYQKVNKVVNFSTIDQTAKLSTTPSTTPSKGGYKLRRKNSRRRSIKKSRKNSRR